MVILATHITVLEISRKPKSTMNDTSKSRKKRETGQEREERTVVLALPISILDISRKP